MFIINQQRRYRVALHFTWCIVFLAFIWHGVYHYGIVCTLYIMIWRFPKRTLSGTLYIMRWHFPKRTLFGTLYIMRWRFPKRTLSGTLYIMRWRFPKRTLFCYIIVCKEVQNVKNFFVNVWRKNIFDIYVTEYGTALTTILPICSCI